MTVARSVARAVASPVARPVAGGIGTGGAVTFNGSSDYIDTLLTMNGWTAFTVFRRGVYLSTSGFDLDGFVNTVNSQSVRIGRNNNAVGVYANGGTLSALINAATPVIANDSEHSLALSSASGGTARLYLNGAQVNSTPAGSWTISNNRNFTLGASNAAGTLEHYSNYRLSEYKIYDRQLTADEITWLHSQGASGTNPTTANLQLNYPPFPAFS